MAAQVTALVETINAARGDIRALTSYNLETKSKGKLYGDATVRGLRDRLAAAVVGNGTSSAGLAGVSVTRDGTVTFDKAKFLKALADDPVKVEQALGGTVTATTADGRTVQNGLAARIAAVAEGASRGAASVDGPGLLQSSITSRERQVSSLRQNISDWDERLKLRQTTLQRQYAALETALGASQRQGQWLAGQIAGLPGWG